MSPRIAISSNSLGRGALGGHDIFTKFKAASREGFEGIELAWECLTHHAASYKNEKTCESDALRAASADVKRIADGCGLVLLSLMPFMGFDALPQGDRLESRFQDAIFWLELCKIMEIKFMQIPTCLSYIMKSDELDMDFDNLAKNMGRLADVAATYGITLAYEAPAWGAAMLTWQQVEEVRQLARRSNIKHCLDTFHIAAIVAGDPENQNGSWLHSDSDARVQADADQLAQTLKAEDIAYFQLSDAEPVDLQQRGYVSVDLAQPFYMTWSRNCRVFPYEGILPVSPCIKAVLQAGYDGWFSMEIFHTDLASKEQSIPLEWARRGMESWKKVKQECGM